jgi:uncharacterized protein YjgD (DUF1641 family)
MIYRTDKPATQIEVVAQLKTPWEIEEIFIGGGDQIFVMNTLTHLNNRYLLLNRIDLSMMYPAYLDTINHRVEVITKQNPNFYMMAAPSKSTAIWIHRF